MSCKTGFTGIAEALRHVFFPPSSFKVAQHTGLLRHPHSRGIVSIPTGKPLRPPKHRQADPKAWGPQSQKTGLKDEAIDADRVCVVDANGSIGRPQNKFRVLESFDREKFFLVQVGKDDFDTPLCKLMSKEKIYAQEKQQGSGGKPAKEHKEVEIPWKAAEGDIEHKLKLAQGFLEDGQKVDVILIARRPREVVKDLKQAQAVVDNVLGKISKIDKVKNIIDKDSVLGRSVTIHLEGPPVQKVKKKKETTAKEIEVLWGISDAELEKRRFRIAELLESKIPVDLIITAKKKQFEISPEQGQQVLERIWRTISRIRGVYEIEPREGEPGKTVTLFLGSKAEDVGRRPSISIDR